MSFFGTPKKKKEQEKQKEEERETEEEAREAEKRESVCVLWVFALGAGAVPRKGAAFSVLLPGGLPAESHYRQLKTLKPASAEYKRMTRPGPRKFRKFLGF
ncbi:MAG: hypothetical protein LCH37_14970 [Bacteroidetes bacterium]|nr:hypothetical protein [Bacteroidota bacterium]